MVRGDGDKWNLSGRTVLEQKPSMEGFHVLHQRRAQTLRYVCHANGLSHHSSPARSQFNPVYTADDELAGALEQLNDEVNPALITLPMLLEREPSSSILGCSHRQNKASLQLYPSVR